jgi:DNA-binding HxlR family transcriptional regulator
MTTTIEETTSIKCPAETLLKELSGKWKSHIFKLALQKPLRFNTLLKQLAGANRQSLSVALKEMVTYDLLSKTIINHKPLHIEYVLTEKGKSLIPVFLQLENLT